MRIARKVYMSIFTTLFILITCIATTFAWVGMTTTTMLGGFDLNLKVENIDAEYFLMISNSGNVGTFSDTLNPYTVKREILSNMGYSTDLVLDEGLDSFFTKNANMEPVTTNKNLDNFYSLCISNNTEPFLKEHNGYFKFDLYLSIDTLKGISGMSQEELNNLNINANVFFENIESALVGTINQDSLINSNPFSTIPSGSDFEILNSINHKKVKVDTKNATRIAFQLYNPIAIDDTYEGNEIPNKTIIYQGGKQLPNLNNDVFDLGGILPEDYNLALKEINKIYDTNIQLNNMYIDRDNNARITNDEKVPYLGAYERYNNGNCFDLEMSDSNNVIWQKPDNSSISGTNYLGVQNGVLTKMKISVYFWYEGYDADCLRLIDFRPTSLNILFSTDKDDN